MFRRTILLRINHHRYFLLYLSFFLFCKVAAQDITLEGKVVDAEKKTPIEHVTVRIVGNNLKGTSTNAKGEFTIKAAKTASLSFKIVGYEMRTIALNGDLSTILSVALKPLIASMDEVVVTGYLQEKKADLNTSVSVVNTKKMSEQGLDNFQTFLQGKSAGVQVTQANGSEPGGGLSIQIRGAGSLSTTTQPLYVVDGVPLESPNLSLNSNSNAYVSNGSSAASPLSSLNPNDIESIIILKDASATAIYGSRGSNGVVLITTKSGKVGTAKVTFSVNEAAATQLRFLKLLNSKDYAAFVDSAWSYRKSQGLISAATPEPFLQSDIDTLPNYDHQRELARTAFTSDVNLSITGGERGNRYYLSGQYFDQQGVIPTTEMKRYVFGVRYQPRLSGNFTLNTSLNLTGTVRNGQPTQTLQQAAQTWAPTSPLINPDGTINQIANYYYGQSHIVNPTYGSLYYNSRLNPSGAGLPISVNPLSFASPLGIQNLNKAQQLLGNIKLDYTISPGFTLTGIMSLTLYNAQLQNYVPNTTRLLYAPYYSGEASLGASTNVHTLYQFQANYIKTFNGINHVNAVVVTSAEKTVNQVQTSSSTGFVANESGFNSVQSGTTPGVPTSSYADYQLVSTAAQFSYDYDRRYYVTASGRMDGSSKFATGNKFGFFPSIGLSWRTINEKWFNESSLSHLFSDLKLRGSWGLVGNQNIGSYNTLNTLSAVSTALGGTVTTGYRPTLIPNPNLKWEKGNSFDLGLDIALLKNRISLTVDGYEKLTNNLLYQAQIPLTSGFATQLQNIASIKNQGLEFTLNTVNIDKGNFRWLTSFNISFNKNEVTKLTGNPSDVLYLNSTPTGLNIFRIVPGQPIGQFWGWKTIGVWNANTILTKPTTFQPGAREGDRRYADLNNDGVLDNNDGAYIGSALPKFNGGFSTSFIYKNIELSASFSYSYGNKEFNYFLLNSGGTYGNSNLRQVDYDQMYSYPYANASTDIQQRDNTTKISVAGSSQDTRASTDLYVEDASFLSCRDLNLSYGLPAKMLSRWSLYGARVYFDIQNLFMITKYSGLNPEANQGNGTGDGLARGIDNGSYPIARSFRMGVNLTF